MRSARISSSAAVSSPPTGRRRRRPWRLALQAGDVLEVPVDLFADRPALLQNRLAEELLLPDGAALDEEAVLGPAIALQGVQGGGGLSLLVLGLRQRGGVPPQQRRPGGVQQAAGGLGGKGRSGALAKDPRRRGGGRPGASAPGGGAGEYRVLRASQLQGHVQGDPGLQPGLPAGAL